MVEAQRARHRARYIAAKAGGEGVRPEGSPANPNPITPAQKIFPMVPVSSASLDLGVGPGLDSGPAPALVPASGFIQHEPKGEVVFSEVQDPTKFDVSPAGSIDRLTVLVKALQGQVTTYTPEARAAMDELVKDYSGMAPADLAPPLSVPALPVGWDDPTMVWKGKVIKALGRNKWLFKPFKLSLRPEGALHVRHNILMKEGWTVWTVDNPYTDQGGYTLWGEYNRFGERMK